MHKKLKTSIIGILTLLSFYALLLIFPKPLFSYSYTYKKFIVYSDKEIPVEIESVLDIVDTNISKSELYDNTFSFNIYICQSKRLFYFLTRNANAGGNVQGILSPNVFIRESDISQNKLIPPSGWMYSTDERPLSYFIAHELTHSLQAKLDRFLILKVPSFVLEGYADYIGKREFFNYKNYCSQLVNHHPYMQESSPLYNRYHLYMAHLLDKKKLSFQDILSEIPPLESTLIEIKQDCIHN